jgi:hypothetical protein
MGKKETLARLRASLDGNDTFVSGGHGIIKTAGATQHASRMGKIPLWVLDDSKIKLLINSRFPKASFDPEQRKLAARMVRVIHLYYRVGLTAAGVAEQLNMTANAVDHIIRRTRKQMSTFLKPSHRPKKGGGIQPTSGSTGVDHTSL